MIAILRKHLAGLLAGGLLMGAAAAHEIRPAIVSATFTPERYEIAIVANLEALLAGIGPTHQDSDDSPSAAQYNQLRALSADALRARVEEFAPRWLDGIRVEFDGERVRPQIAAIEIAAPGD